MKDYVVDVSKSGSQKRDCLKDKKGLQDQLEKLQKDLLDLRDDHRNSKERLRTAETFLGEKTDKIELTEVK